MVNINPANVLKMLNIFFRVSSLHISPENNEEIMLYENIKNIMLEYMNNNVDVDIDTTLEFENNFGCLEMEAIEEDVYQDDTEYKQGEVEATTCDLVDMDIDTDYKRNAVEFWESGKTKKLKLDTVKHRFKKVTSVQQLHRWKQSLDKGGTKKDKLTRITEYVINKFNEAINEKKIIHDIDLKRWALEINYNNIDLKDFKASMHWIKNLKKRYRIVSRKITKFITRFSKSDHEKLITDSDEFVERVRPYIYQYGPESTFNADESGFNLEMHTGRTLAYKSVKSVEGEVQSITSTTHSYSILPAISANGKLLPVLFIVLKEIGGTFGPRVQKTLFEAPNVIVKPSSSGKLTSDLFIEWFTNCYLPNTGSRSVILLDSWGGHKPNNLKDYLPKNKQVEIFTLPKKTTNFLQPLDVYGFRVWKHFIKIFSDLIVLNNYDINLHERNNIIKLQSLTHNQLSAPRYKPLFQYAWFKSGYILTHPDKFKTPTQFCFKEITGEIQETCDICGQPAVIRCSWCKKYLCIKHFFEEYHYCTHDVDAYEKQVKKHEKNELKKK